MSDNPLFIPPLYMAYTRRRIYYRRSYYPKRNYYRGRTYGRSSYKPRL